MAFIVLLSNRVSQTDCIDIFDENEDDDDDGDENDGRAVVTLLPFANDSFSEWTLFDGMEAEENEFNYMVYVIRYDNGKLCSGCLVSTDLVLTAGYCIAKANRDHVMVAGGKSHLSSYLLERMNTPFDKIIGFKYLVEERKAWNVFVHPKYNKHFPHFANVGFVRIKYSFSKKLVPITVATSKYHFFYSLSLSRLTSKKKVLPS